MPDFFFCIYFCDLFRLDQVTVASLKGGTLIMDYDKKELKPTSHGTATVGNTFLGHSLLQEKHGVFSVSVTQSFLIS